MWLSPSPPSSSLPKLWRNAGSRPWERSAVGGLSSSLEYTPGESTRPDELDESGEEGTVAVVRRCGVRLVIVDAALESVWA